MFSPPGLEIKLDPEAPIGIQFRVFRVFRV